MQNLFASIMLCAWAAVAICLFATQTLRRAALWTLMGAQLALPVGAYFKFEMIPQFDKFSIPNLCVLLGCLLVARRPLRIMTTVGLAEILIVALLVGPIVTSLLNGDPTIVGAEVRPGVGIYDALSYAENSFIYMIPFFVGRQFLTRSEDITDVIYVIALAGLLYSVPLLYEIRMAPTLQAQIYGFSPTNFAMTARWGGYRPMAFMGHGLVTCFFAMTTVVASTALWRARERLFSFPPIGVTTYLAGVLILCKSLGALVYGAFLVPVLRWASPRISMNIAVILASVALLYPALRSFGLFPTQSILQVTSLISEERELSLEFRFINEDKLLDRAFERPVFGWGRYGRNRVYSEQTGADASVTDGFWVIVIGQFGLCGFIAQFGLLSLGVFKAASSAKLVKSSREVIFLSALALIVATTLVEQIPNSSILPWSWLLSGALLGRAETLRRRVSQARSRLQRQSHVAARKALPA